MAAALAATAQSALPSLAIDSFPPAAREAISRVQREAAAQSDNPRSVGALASTLHAWELWDAAHEAYARAQGLDRGAFDWRYLDAIVLQRLARHADAATRLREALALSPGYLPARVKLAEALLESGRARGEQGALHRAGRRARGAAGRRSRARTHRGRAGTA